MNLNSLRSRLDLILLICAIVGSVWTNSQLNAQVLNADQFGKEVDSLDNFSGEFNVGLDLNKQKDLLFNAHTKMEMSYLIKHHLAIFSGAFNLFRSGSENLLNGGYAHLRFRQSIDKRFHPEYYGQIQLDAARGLETRALGGANLRIRIVESEKGGIFFAQGLMYEYERWNYDGVDDDIEIIDNTPVERKLLKLNTYLSFNQDITKHVRAVLMIYFQARPDAFISKPRISGDAQLAFKITEKILFTVSYSAYFDSEPIVPIDRFFFSMRNKITFIW